MSTSDLPEVVAENRDNRASMAVGPVHAWWLGMNLKDETIRMPEVETLPRGAERWSYEQVMAVWDDIMWDSIEEESATWTGAGTFQNKRILVDKIKIARAASVMSLLLRSGWTQDELDDEIEKRGRAAYQAQR